MLAILDEPAREPQLSVIAAELIADRWPMIETILEEALFTGSKTPHEVRDALIAGKMECWLIQQDDGTHGLVVTSVGTVKDSDILACWVVYAAGEVAGGVKARLGTMRALMGKFEALARARGCVEMRVEGLRWRKVLLGAGYERHGDIIRKVL